MTRAESAGRLSDAAWGVAGVLLVFGGWEAASRLGLIDPLFLPAPTRALAVTLERVPPGVLAGHVAASLVRIVWGFGIGAALGVALGIALGWYRALDGLLRPLIDLLRPIPPLAWIPIAIVWFGLGEPSKVFVIFLGAFFPVWTNTYRGMTGVDPILFRAAQTMGHRGPSLLFRVAIPAVMPDIATGIRVGWGLSFGVLVAAELIAAERGMGFMIMEARQLGEIGVVIFG
ncbi:MAG TPA: ABC transporter permease, partial [Geminicoccaceae bacterium]|nr:ABC transporter permease [Geminicoccaceae bacterium]